MSLIRDDGYDIATGHRFFLLRQTRQLHRHLLSRSYRVISQFALGFEIKDSETGCKFFKRATATRVVLGTRNDGWFWDTEVMAHAALQGLPFRSPHRLLDSAAASKAFLFAKQQGLEVPFLMRVYMQGWGSGWRDYELESLEALRGTLTKVGAETEGFDAFAAPDGPGAAELESCIAGAEATGFVGVPHYVFDDAGSGRRLGLFGREHLALIREKFQAQGLARTPDVRPDFSHAWRGPPVDR